MVATLMGLILVAFLSAPDGMADPAGDASYRLSLIDNPEPGEFIEWLDGNDRIAVVGYDRTTRIRQLRDGAAKDVWPGLYALKTGAVSAKWAIDPLVPVCFVDGRNAIRFGMRMAGGSVETVTLSTSTLEPVHSTEPCNDEAVRAKMAKSRPDYSVVSIFELADGGFAVFLEAAEGAISARVEILDANGASRYSAGWSGDPYQGRATYDPVLRRVLLYTVPLAADRNEWRTTGKLQYSSISTDGVSHDLVLPYGQWSDSGAFFLTSTKGHLLVVADNSKTLTDPGNAGVYLEKGGDYQQLFHGFVDVNSAKLSPGGNTLLFTTQKSRRLRAVGSLDGVTNFMKQLVLMAVDH